MFLTFNERPSDSPYVERVWRSQSHSAGVFLSVAASHFEIAVTRHRGLIFLTVRGPETRATPAECPAEGEWLGIRFRLGTFMPAFMPGDLKDRRDVTLPGAATRSFWLCGSAWDTPISRMRIRSWRGSRGRESSCATLPSKPRWSTSLAACRSDRRSGAFCARPESPTARFDKSSAPGMHDSPDTGRLDPRHGLRRRLLRSGPPHPIRENPDWPDAGGDQPRQAAAVVFIQNSAAAANLRCGWEVD